MSVTGFLTLRESVRRALVRKRRLRMIYKWRHGLEHSHQPAHRDRRKLVIIRWVQLDLYAEHVLAPVWRKLGDEIAARLMR
jgi:hypothetical protein